MNADSELERYFDSILQPLIDIFEENEALAYPDSHGNFFVDLGWDVVCGDGRLIELAEGMLQPFVEELPPMMQNWLWWQLPGGRVEARYNKAALEKSPPDYSSLMTDLSEIQSDLFDEVKRRLLVLAERAYDLHQKDQPE